MTVNLTTFTEALSGLTYERHVPPFDPPEPALYSLVQMATRHFGTDRDDLADAAEYAREQAAALRAHADWMECQAATYIRIAAAVDGLIAALPPATATQGRSPEGRQPAKAPQNAQDVGVFGIPRQRPRRRRSPRHPPSTSGAAGAGWWVAAAARHKLEFEGTKVASAMEAALYGFGGSYKDDTGASGPAPETAADLFAALEGAGLKL